MNRIEKVRALQAIKEGRLLATDLREKIIFIFWQQEYGRSQDFSMDGKIYTNVERLKFCDEIEAGNFRRKACGLEEDFIISILYGDTLKNDPED